MLKKIIEKIEKWLIIHWWVPNIAMFIGLGILLWLVAK